MRLWSEWQKLHEITQQIRHLELRNPRAEFCRYVCCNEQIIVVYRELDALPHCCNCGTYFGQVRPKKHRKKCSSKYQDPLSFYGDVCPCCDICWFPIGILPLKNRPWDTVEECEQEFKSRLEKLTLQQQELILQLA